MVDRFVHQQGTDDAAIRASNEFVRDGFSTNSIESVWAVLKRGVYGTFHHVSPKHLGRYIDELTFRIATLSLKGAQEIADGKKTEPI